MGIFEAAAAPGRAVGRGLMGVGQVYEQVREKNEQKKEKERLQKEQEQQKRFSQTMSAVKIFTKMGESLSPENRQKLFTMQLLPMISKAGGFPEDMDVKGATEFIATLSAADENALKIMHADFDQVLDLLDKGKKKEARRSFTEIQKGYGVNPSAKKTLEQWSKLLDAEIKDIEGEKQTRKSAEDKIMAGSLIPSKPGEQGFERGGMMVRGKTPQEKTTEAVGRAKAIKKAELDLQKQYGGGEDTRTAKQKEYAQFKEEMPSFKGTILDYQKALKAQDKKASALKMAGQDERVKLGDMTLDEAYQEYYRILTGEPKKDEEPDRPEPPAGFKY